MENLSIHSAADAPPHACAESPASPCIPRGELLVGNASAVLMRGNSRVDLISQTERESVSDVTKRQIRAIPLKSISASSEESLLESDGETIPKFSHLWGETSRGDSDVCVRLLWLIIPPN